MLGSMSIPSITPVISNISVPQHTELASACESNRKPDSAQRLRIAAVVCCAAGIALLTESVQLLGDRNYSDNTKDLLAGGGFISLYISLGLMVLASYSNSIRSLTQLPKLFV